MDEILGVWSIQECQKGFSLPGDGDLLALKVKGKDLVPPRYQVKEHKEKYDKIHTHIKGSWTITQVSDYVVSIVQYDGVNTIQYYGYYMNGFLTIGTADDPDLATQSLTLFTRVEYEGDAAKNPSLKIKLNGWGTQFDLAEGDNVPT